MLLFLKLRILHVLYITKQGVDSSAGTATRYGLDGPGIKYQCWGKFSAPVETDPGTHPASYTMGTGSLSRV